jgi:hypothetical protein
VKLHELVRHDDVADGADAAGLREGHRRDLRPERAEHLHRPIEGELNLSVHLDVLVQVRA